MAETTPPPERLGGGEALGRLFETGAVGRSRHVMARLLPNGLERPRVTAIAARRLGSAVRRNRLRRRLRAALQELAGELPPADIALLARHGREPDFPELVAAVREAVEKAWRAASRAQRGA